MKKFFILMVCISVMSQTQAFAHKVRTFAPLQPQQTVVPEFEPMQALNIPQDVTAVNEKYPKITELEYHLFNKSFENESIYSRLTRLENKVFKKSYAGQSLSNRVDNLMSNVDEGIFYGIKNKDLMKLEMKVLGRVYPSDDTESRITRLEKEMIGAMQSGNLKDRYETVKLASKHYNSYPEIVQNNNYYPNSAYGYYPQNYVRNPNGGIVNNILSKLFGDMPYGALTGFTPPIYDSYNQYSPYYGAYPNTGMQDYCMGNTGGYYKNRSYGGGSGVRILN